MTEGVAESRTKAPDVLRDDPETESPAADISPLRRLRRHLAPPGSRRERAAQFIYGPVIDALPRKWRVRLKPPERFIPDIVILGDIGVEEFRAWPIRRIVVLKLDHIGDMIIGMRAMRALRESFPTAHITLVCASWNEVLAHRLGLFDRIVCYDFFTPMNRDWLAASLNLQPLYDGIMALKLGSCDLAVDLRHDADTRPCLFRLDTKYRAGFYAPVEPGLPHLDLMLPLTEGIPLGEGVEFSLQADLRLRVLSAAVIDAFGPPRPHPIAILAPPERDETTARFAVLAIGAGDPIRCWPIERYAKLGHALVARHGLDIVVLGGKAESEDAARLAGSLPDGKARIVIGMPVAELPALLGRAALCVCNGSGMSHLAAALGVPTVCILGGTTRMEVWHPAGANVLSIGGKTPCQPCALRLASECQWGVACLDVIKPADVLGACERLLRLTPAARRELA